MNAIVAQERLLRILNGYPRLAIAVSGGVDSMTLAYIAHRMSTVEVEVLHAVSPAVPASATRRVERFATACDWSVRFVDAGELADPMYTSNPVDRCFHCKTNLYRRIRFVTNARMASGTNLDDLTDFRPGLRAAADHGVVHPFVEARIGKADIYALARANGLAELASLRAQPCLSSRIETGNTVDAATLAFIETMESGLSVLLPNQASIRCRVSASGVVIECSDVGDATRQSTISDWAVDLCKKHERAFLGFRNYRRGSAFIRVSDERI